ncbi:MAG: hypothetical protein RLY78_2776 [Pseudomonadota bacterium]
MSTPLPRRHLLQAALATATAAAGITATALPLASHAAQPVTTGGAPLTLTVHNPAADGIFPVNSVLVSGPTEAVLIDAQFQRKDAQALVRLIQASGKRLTTILISHGDPDYYFGLDVLQAAFPQARIVATAETVAHIQASKDAKLAYWGPILKDDAPQTLVVPQVLSGHRLTVDGQTLEITGPEATRRVVWIPSLRAVVGGIPVLARIHVWMADTQSPASRQAWRSTLRAIEALRPAVIVPGHELPAADGRPSRDLSALRFTRDYLDAFETEAARARDAAGLIAAMQRRYPDLGEVSSLEISAKVIKGEMAWPQ